ncbi:MAG: ferrochelatase [Gammaproteobacteria bacterium]|nr:ferrochelatase [Gammaproteobacteria bacterium]
MSVQPRTGILITNLGSPDAPTPTALRRYLAEFLWDRRIVDLPRVLWWPILHGIILRTRPARSARLYEAIWTDEGAPLINITRRQRDALSAALRVRTELDVPVAIGMRYGNPSIASALRELDAAGVQRLIVLPLYPQNSCSTTGSTFDALADAMRQRRFVPDLHFIGDYHDHPGYIAALVASIREAWATQPPGERLLFSFHGTPERFRSEGDVYHEQCLHTAGQVATQLQLAPDRWQVVFQSRFGREEWLKPYADETLAALPSEGIASVDVICPGFAADCLETLEEMAETNRKLFLNAGGKAYRYIPALNDREDHIAFLADIVVGAL